MIVNVWTYGLKILHIMEYNCNCYYIKDILIYNKICRY